MGVAVTRPANARYDDPDLIEAVRSLVTLGTGDGDISSSLEISRATVLRLRRYAQIDPAIVRRGDKPPEPKVAPRSVLIAAAQPWRQHPWSAKDTS